MFHNSEENHPALSSQTHNREVSSQTTNIYKSDLINAIQEYRKSREWLTWILSKNSLMEKLQLFLNTSQISSLLDQAPISFQSFVDFLSESKENKLLSYNSLQKNPWKELFLKWQQLPRLPPEIWTTIFANIDGLKDVIHFSQISPFFRDIYKDSKRELTSYPTYTSNKIWGIKGHLKDAVILPNGQIVVAITLSKRQKMQPCYFYLLNENGQLQKEFSIISEHHSEKEYYGYDYNVAALNNGHIAVCDAFSRKSNEKNKKWNIINVSTGKIIDSQILSDADIYCKGSQYNIVRHLPGSNLKVKSGDLYFDDPFNSTSSTSNEKAKLIICEKSVQDELSWGNSIFLPGNKILVINEYERVLYRQQFNEVELTLIKLVPNLVLEAKNKEVDEDNSNRLCL